MNSETRQKTPVPMRQTAVYKNEYTDTLNRLWKENQKVSYFKFFLDTAHRRFDASAQAKPAVAVLRSEEHTSELQSRE